jgi:hypothetical protein
MLVGREGLGAYKVVTHDEGLDEVTTGARKVPEWPGRRRGRGGSGTAAGAPAGALEGAHTSDGVACSQVCSCSTCRNSQINLNLNCGTSRPRALINPGSSASQTLGAAPLTHDDMQGAGAMQTASTDAPPSLAARSALLRSTCATSAATPVETCPGGGGMHGQPAARGNDDDSNTRHRGTANGMLGGVETNKPAGRRRGGRVNLAHTADI